LRYAWDGGGGWREVGLWYKGLLAAVQPDDAAINAQAKTLLDPADGARQHLDALTDFVSAKVRYVAVEVGIGGYQPSNPGEVLERRWGDCKDKSILLIDLLQRAGIDAHPALILADNEGRIDPEFPSPDQFNHLIVAVPATAVETRPEDPVASGYLFIDPTQTRNAGRWLSPAVQGQHALVVGDDGGTLLSTPIHYDNEKRRLVVSLKIQPTGQGIGDANIRLTGRSAMAFMRLAASATEQELLNTVRQVFATLLPGAKVSSLTYHPITASLPTVDLAAAVAIDRFVQGGPSRPSFRMPEFHATPEPGLLAEGEGPIALYANTTELRWHLSLPPGWCPPQMKAQNTDNPVGRFSQSLEAREGGGLVLSRDVIIRRRFIEREGLEDLRQLSLAEHRASRRRIRLHCPENLESPESQSSLTPGEP
jgi:hypothetical protein